MQDIFKRLEYIKVLISNLPQFGFFQRKYRKEIQKDILENIEYIQIYLKSLENKK